MRTETLHVKIKSSGCLEMSKNYEDGSHKDNRLSLETLRSYTKYQNVTDEEGEAIIDDTIALARMILDIMK